MAEPRLRQGRPGTGDQVEARLARGYPADRAKSGTKRGGVLTEADSGPLAVGVTGANVHGSLPLPDALAAAIVEPPDTPEAQQHLCGDKALDGGRASRRPRCTGTPPISAGSVRRRKTATGARRKSPGGGWWNGRSVG